MNLYEYEGKKLFSRYGIAVPRSVLWRKGNEPRRQWMKNPVVLKAQILAGERKKAGGILFVSGAADVARRSRALLRKTIAGEAVKKILVEERVLSAREWYVSFSYDTARRAPVLALSSRGGTGILNVRVFPIDLASEVEDFFFRDAICSAGFRREDVFLLLGVVKKLWSMFWSESLLLAEINPLFQTSTGELIAGDAKIILDDEKVDPSARRFISLGGDIAILASGGGASLLSIDALVRAGGRPANYTEYSGNPPASVVRALTKKVLSQKGLRGCWVVGGTANFTDIYETLSGFVAGLGEVKPKPRYPIVIRRDGPRQREAFGMLEGIGKAEGYELHLFGSETSISESARTIVEHAYGKKSKRLSRDKTNVYSY